MELEEMYREHARQVYLYLLSLSHDRELSEDLTQETFVKASMKIRNFRHESTLSSWLCSIARSLYFDVCRKKKRDPEPTDSLSEDVKDPRDHGSLPVFMNCRSLTAKSCGSGSMAFCHLRRLAKSSAAANPGAASCIIGGNAA